MNIKSMIKDWLKTHGFGVEGHEHYEGLYNPDFECGCGIDDLFLCNGFSIEYCKAGYRLKSDDPNYDFLIGSIEIQPASSNEGQFLND